MNISFSKEKRQIYSRWNNMNSRCYNPDATSYQGYGGRGITVSDEWKDFENFYEWSLKSGFSKELQLDRKNNDKEYSPDNCRWVTPRQNLLNRRGNVYAEINGESKTISEWCEITGLDQGTFRFRMHSGWTGNDLLRPPLAKGQRLK